MKVSDYIEESAKTAIYPNIGSNMEYPILGLFGEIGEVCDQVKKIFRDDGGVIKPPRREKLKKELGDVLWYFAATFREIPISDNTGVFESKNFSDLSDAVARDRSIEFSLFRDCRHLVKMATLVDPKDPRVEPLDDIIILVARICAQVGLDLTEVAESNIAKLKSRQERKVLAGDGNDR